jgi:hypothetical protein
MKPSPIQLLQLTFKRVHVEIDPEHAPAEPPNPLTAVFVFDGVSLTTEVGLAEVDMDHERGPMYLVSLQLLIDNEAVTTDPDRKFSPYRIDIETAGIILLPRGAETLGPPHDLVLVNGAALLWSAIREQLLSLTSRMPAGPVMLPTVHFHDLKQPPTAAAQTAPQQIATTTNKVAKTKAAGKKAAQA